MQPVTEKISFNLSEGLDFYFYPHLHSLIDKKRTEIIIKNIKGETVLDAGSGRGNLSLCARKDGYEVIAIDLSLSSLNEASYLFSNEAVDIPLLGASINALPLQDNSIDTIICADVIEHVPEAAEALNEMNRVLNKGGRLIISIPNAATFGLFYDHIVSRLISIKKQTPFAYKRYFKISDEEIASFGWDNKMIYPHCNDFTLNGFRNLLLSSGYDIKKTENWRFLNPYIRSFFTLLGLGPVKVLERLDMAVADHIPSRLAADWIFICEKR